jgi:hypothetical protein
VNILVQTEEYDKTSVRQTGVQSEAETWHLQNFRQDCTWHMHTKMYVSRPTYYVNNFTIKRISFVEPKRLTEYEGSLLTGQQTDSTGRAETILYARGSQLFFTDEHNRSFTFRHQAQT